MPRSWRCLWNISRSLLPFFENYANCSFLIKWLQPETLKTEVTLLKQERSRRVRHLPFTWENREFRLQNQMVHARSVWEASENMGCDLRRCNILILLGCTTDLDILYSHRVKFSSINFMHKIACITGTLWAKRSERCILREERNKCKARDESPPRTSPRLARRTCFALLAKCCVRLAWLIKRLLCRLCTRFLLGGFCVNGKHPLVSFSRTSKETWHAKTQKKVRNDLNLLGQSRLQTRLWLRSYRSPFREIPHFLHCQTHSRGEPKEYKHGKKISDQFPLNTGEKFNHLSKHSGKRFRRKKKKKKKERKYPWILGKVH